MIKLTVVIKVQHFDESLDLSRCDLDFVFIAVGVALSKVIAELLELLGCDVPVSKHLLFNVVYIVNKPLESNELLERHSALNGH